MRVKVEMPFTAEIEKEIAQGFRDDLEDQLDVMILHAADKFPKIPQSAAKELLGMGMRGTLEVIDDNQGAIVFDHGEEFKVSLFDGLAEEFFGKINS